MAQTNDEKIRMRKPKPGKPVGKPIDTGKSPGGPQTPGAKAARKRKAKAAAMKKALEQGIKDANTDARKK